MELHFLGRGAAFYVEAGNTSAYLREGAVCCCSTAAKASLPIFCGAACFPA